jgi:hypothetical protein
MEGGRLDVDRGGLELMFVCSPPASPHFALSHTFVLTQFYRMMMWS